MGNPSSDGYAALKEDGSVVTWGDPDEEVIVVVQLSSGVKEIFTNFNSYAAGRTDAGDSSNVSSQLSSGVKEIFTNYSKEFMLL